MIVELIKIINRCNSLSGWSYTGTLSLTSASYEGKYALMWRSDDPSHYFKYSNRSFDLSLFSTMKLAHRGYLISEGESWDMYLYTDESNYAYWRNSIVVEWTEFTFDLNNPTSETGTLDLSNITEIKFMKSDLPGGFLFIDYIYCIGADITSDICSSLSFIEHSIRDYPRCNFLSKGTWIPLKDDIIRIYDYLTSNGETKADQIIFEGTIKDYDLRLPRKIWCESRAKRDLDEFRPSGDYNGDLDSNHIKTLIGGCSYITEGTIDATTGNTDNTFKGDKTFRTILNDWADKHYKHWYLSPIGVLNFNDANIDSGEDFDQDDKIWNVVAKRHVDSINWVMLLGALVNNVQIEAESKDDDSIDQLGAKIYKDTYAFMKIKAQLQITADNLRIREQLLPLAIDFWCWRANKGFYQVAETVTFAHNKMSPVITSRQVIINKIIYRFLSGHTDLQTTDGIVFIKDKDKALPQENSLLIQQNAEAIASGTKIATGTYTGNENNNRQITGLGFTPKAISVIYTWNGSCSFYYINDAMPVWICYNIVDKVIKTNRIKIIADGFELNNYAYDDQLNIGGNVYYWTAWG